MYKAFITPLTAVRPHPNADRLQLATCLGAQVVVGLDAVDGTLGVFFPEGGALSHEMALANDLYNSSARTALELGPGPTGFFDVNRRVRAQRFRGEKSEGIWLPLSSLAWFDVDIHEYATPGKEIEDARVAVKYETPGTKRRGAESKRSTRRGETVMFRKHVDTAQFAYYGHLIPAGSLITLTEKLHGTSGRLTRSLEEHPTRWYHRLLGIAPGASWQVLNGTRNVIMEHSSGTGFYGDETFRHNAVAGIFPRKGETLYFELVGWAGVQPIMPPQPVPKNELPDVYKTYGPAMSYYYGVTPGQTALYVYRITQTNEDGCPTELSWPQVKARCAELGIDHVPQLTEPLFTWNGDAGLPYLQVLVDLYTAGPSTLDSSQIREGCCLRIDTPDGRTYWLKNKSYEFKVLEGIIKLDDNHIDMEEAA